MTSHSHRGRARIGRGHVLFSAACALALAVTATPAGAQGVDVDPDATAPPPAETASTVDDRAAWLAAREAGDPAALEAYLEAYPLGRHADDAFDALIAATVRQELRSAGLRAAAFDGF